VWSSTLAQPTIIVYSFGVSTDRSSRRLNAPWARKRGGSLDDGRLEVHFRAGPDENCCLFMNHSNCLSQRWLARELELLAGQGAVGHLCGHFLRADGSVVNAEDAPFLLGIGADELRHIPQRIAVAAGRHKVAPIAAAISGGIISELVTDQATAAALVLLLQD